MKSKKNFIISTILIASIFIAVLLIYTISIIFELRSTDSSNFRTLISYSITLSVLELIIYILYKKGYDFPLLLLCIYISTILIDVMGENFAFYQTIEIWDVIGHTIGGSFFFLGGFTIINYFLKESEIPLFFLIVFCFGVSIICETVWELAEYTSDLLTGSNMLRATDSLTGKELLGLEATKDMIEDIALTFLGCIFASILVIFNKKNKYKYLTINKT